jgi:hypothetical protein
MAVLHAASIQAAIKYRLGSLAAVILRVVAVVMRVEAGRDALCIGTADAQA